MARQEYFLQGTTPSAATEKTRARENWTQQGWFRLLALIILLEVFMPFLVWPVGIPRFVLGAIEAGIGLVILVAFAYMMKEDRVPMAVLLK